MNAPQIIVIVMFTISLTASAFLHDEYKTGKHNFFVDLIGAAIMLSLLFWGGFFR
jgi:hypothetical protein